LRNKYGVEGEVEWDCLADEKKGKGLPPKDPIRKKEAISVPAVAADVTEIVKKDSDASATLEKKVAVEVGKEDATIEDAYEFDDEEMNKLFSS